MYTIPKSLVDGLPFNFEQEIVRFRQAVEDHKHTIDEPAPSSHPIVEQIVRDNLEYTIVDDTPEHIELPPVEFPPAPDPNPLPTSYHWERVLDFKLQFTPEQRQAMRDFAKFDPVAEDFLDLLNSATRIVADDPLLRAGLDYMVAHGKLEQEFVNGLLGIT